MSERKENRSPFLLKPKNGGSEPAGKEPELLCDSGLQNPKPEGPVQKEETPQVRDGAYFIRKMRERVMAYHQRSSSADSGKRRTFSIQAEQTERIRKQIHGSDIPVKNRNRKSLKKQNSRNRRKPEKNRCSLICLKEIF